VYYVYIVRCTDNSSSARDIEARVKAHNAGRGAAHTFNNGPIRLVYTEAYGSQIPALKRERQLYAALFSAFAASPNDRLERVQ
jgi:putative endonuclease